MTGKECCTSLAWTDNDFASFFTEKIGGNGDGSKRAYMDALRMLYLSYDQRDAALPTELGCGSPTARQRR